MEGTEMKNIYKVLMGSALVIAAASSCSKLNEAPVFSESESYVAFEKSSYSIAENGGQLTIPVSIAAYNTVKTNVSYSILDVDVEGSGYTAKKGEDFTDQNADAVLIFDGTVWSQNIVINIKEHAGTYTGDLKFAIKIDSASGLKTSAENIVVVTITDNDHPLSSILGTYTAQGKTYSGGDQTAYTLTLSKDSEDLSTVHIDYITYGCKQYASWESEGETWEYIGTVTRDENGNINGINIARGQKTTVWYSSSDDVFELRTFESVTGGSITGIQNTGSFDMTLSGTDPVTWTTDANIWLFPVVYQAYYSNFYTCTPVWTKQ